jgi:hypothetical protein
LPLKPVRDLEETEQLFIPARRYHDANHA